MRDYRKIHAWQEADELAVAVYKVTAGFPREELYGFTSQIRRAAVSVAANIVEGSARGTNKEYLHFLYTARGSLSEVQYMIHLAARLSYISEVSHKELEAGTKSVFVRLHGLIRAVEREAPRGRNVVVVQP